MSEVYDKVLEELDSEDESPEKDNTGRVEDGDNKTGKPTDEASTPAKKVDVEKEKEDANKPETDVSIVAKDDKTTLDGADTEKGSLLEKQDEDIAPKIKITDVTSLASEQSLQFYQKRTMIPPSNTLK